VLQNEPTIDHASRPPPVILIRQVSGRNDPGQSLSNVDITNFDVLGSLNFKWNKSGISQVANACGKQGDWWGPRAPILRGVENDRGAFDYRLILFYTDVVVFSM
jgi:hypothetical protein